MFLKRYNFTKIIFKNKPYFDRNRSNNFIVSNIEPKTIFFSENRRYNECSQNFSIKKISNNYPINFELDYYQIGNGSEFQQKKHFLNVQKEKKSQRKLSYETDNHSICIDEYEKNEIRKSPEILLKKENFSKSKVSIIEINENQDKENFSKKKTPTFGIK